MRTVRCALLSLLAVVSCCAVYGQNPATTASPGSIKPPTASTTTPDSAAGTNARTTPPPPALDALQARAALAPISLGTLALGEEITLPDFGEDPNDAQFQVDIHSVGRPDPPADTETVTREGGALRLKLRHRLDPGQYYFTLQKSGTVIPGIFEIAPDNIKLLSVYPATGFSGANGKYELILTGDNFSLDPRNDDVTGEGGHTLVSNRADKAPASGQENPCGALPACLYVVSPREMRLVNYTPDHFGPLTVGVTVGDIRAADQKQVVLAHYSGGVIFIVSAILTGLLFLAVSWVVRFGLANNKVSGRKLSLWGTFIFDPETNSYSLSKFQLLAFSITFIFAYIYVLLSRWFVQWQFVQPDVPQAIAGLLGISGGATVASAGLTAAKGAKGAGLPQPTGADLISVGGVVVPERFQFFAWTLVFCVGFLALLVGQDPSKVTGIPDVPTGLLYIMGISATGYLGGKATRKPGPILEYVSAQKLPDHRYWTITAQGQNLGADGKFFVGDTGLSIVTDEQKIAFGLVRRPDGTFEDSVTPTQQVGDSDGFSSQLVIKVLNADANAALSAAGSDLTFRLVNRDGQFAEVGIPHPSSASASAAAPPKAPAAAAPAAVRAAAPAAARAPAPAAAQPAAQAQPAIAAEGAPAMGPDPDGEKGAQG